jgi:hypothetical protein
MNKSKHPSDSHPSLSDVSWLEDARLRHWAREYPMDSWGQLPFASGAREEASAALSQLRVQMTSLISQIDCLGLQIGRAEAELSPIRVLPAEVLSEIFMCLGPFQFPKSFDARRLHTLMAVSRRWKEIALETPSLWCDFDFTDRLWFDESGIGRGLKEAAILWLQRSKNAFLSMRFHFDNDSRLKQTLHEFMTGHFQEHLGRMTAVTWSHQEQSWSTVFAEPTANPAKSLYILDQVLQKRRSQLKELQYNSQTTTTILAGEYSRLRRLVLGYLPPGEFKKITAPELTFLGITLRQDPEATSQSSLKVLELIPEMYPKLTSLSITPPDIPLWGEINMVRVKNFPGQTISMVISSLPVLTWLKTSDTFLCTLGQISLPRCPFLEELILTSTHQGLMGVDHSEETIRDWLLGFPRLRIVQMTLLDDFRGERNPIAVTFSTSLINADTIYGCVRNSRIEILRLKNSYQVLLPFNNAAILEGHRVSTEGPSVQCTRVLRRYSALEMRHLSWQDFCVRMVAFREEEFEDHIFTYQQAWDEGSDAEDVDESEEPDDDDDDDDSPDIQDPDGLDGDNWG